MTDRRIHVCVLYTSKQANNSFDITTLTSDEAHTCIVCTATSESNASMTADLNDRVRARRYRTGRVLLRAARVVRHVILSDRTDKNVVTAAQQQATVYTSFNVTLIQLRMS